MSINVNVNLSGSKNILNRINDLKSDKLLEAGLKRGALYLKTQSAIYPPKPPQSTYNRKGAAGGLASGWQIDGEVKDLTVILRNNIPYAQWVQGEKQAWFHKRTGWRNVPTILKDNKERVAELVLDTLRRR
jgi:hypothetical protein